MKTSKLTVTLMFTLIGLTTSACEVHDDFRSKLNSGQQVDQAEGRQHPKDKVSARAK